MIKILIPEDIPSANKGEAALFLGIAKSLDIFHSHRITLFSLHPDEDHQAYAGRAELIDVNGIIPGHMLDGAGSFIRKFGNYLKFITRCTAFGLVQAVLERFCPLIFRHPMWHSCLEADLVLMCHDSFYAPLYHGPLILLFRMLGKPIILYGSTILPPGDGSTGVEVRLRNAFNRYVLRKADWITLREHRSLGYLQSLGIQKVDVHPDLAFIVDTAPDDEMERIFSAEGIPEAGLCGFAFSQKEIGHAFPDLPSSEGRGKALDALAAMMDHITGVLGLHAVFIPHAIGPTARVDDRIAADWVRDRCVNKHKIHIIRNDYSQQQLRGMAKRLELTVGTRLHFTIDATCHQVPSLLITHKDEFRCHGIIGDMLGQAAYVYNIESISPEELTEAVSELWYQRAQVKADLSRRMPEIVAAVRGHAVRAKNALNSQQDGSHESV